MREKKKAVSAPHKISPELKRLAEGVGKFIEYWGFKSIHGKIWTLLFLSSDPMSAVQLARVLRVSKTLLSFSVSELLAYDVIQEAGRGPKRTIYFRANPDISTVIFNVIQVRERPMMSEIHKAVEGLRAKQVKRFETVSQDLQVSQAQLESLGALVDGAQGILDSIGWSSLSPQALAMQFLIVSAALGARGAGETKGS